MSLVSINSAETKIRPRDSALWFNANTPGGKGECTTFPFNQTTFGGLAGTDYTGGTIARIAAGSAHEIHHAFGISSTH